MFVDSEVNKELRKIKTGEHAISFFAKFGNTTPIKFINCIREDGEIFRPYDLTVFQMSEEKKEMILNDYYTISAHGIVHVFTEKGRKN